MNIPFIETSAKNAQNVEQAFLNMSRSIIESKARAAPVDDKPKGPQPGKQQTLAQSNPCCVL